MARTVSEFFVILQCDASAAPEVVRVFSRCHYNTGSARGKASSGFSRAVFLEVRQLAAALPLVKLASPVLNWPFQFQ
jgi:hypothetical protein